MKSKLRKIEREVEELLWLRRQAESAMKIAAGMARLRAQQNG
jgi:hypothetical protein